jgi:hypothetical protein
MADELNRDDERVAFPVTTRSGDGGAEDRLVARLYREGVFRRSRRHWPISLQWAAAAAIFAVGLTAGMYLSSRGSLEAQLNRSTLSASERRQLLERAGSAYARAQQRYIDGEAGDQVSNTPTTVRVLWF